MLIYQGITEKNQTNKQNGVWLYLFQENYGDVKRCCWTEWCTPKSSIFCGGFPLETIQLLGIPYLWKPPNMCNEQVH